MCGYKLVAPQGHNSAPTPCVTASEMSAFVGNRPVSSRRTDVMRQKYIRVHRSCTACVQLSQVLAACETQNTVT